MQIIRLDDPEYIAILKDFEDQPMFCISWYLSWLSLRMNSVAKI
jgi:hypothetical protein